MPLTFLCKRTPMKLDVSNMSVLSIYTIAIFVTMSVLGGEASGGTLCNTPADCTDNNCIRSPTCNFGVCQDDGTCICDPCYQGKNCDIFKKGHHPQFVKSSGLAKVPEDIRGVVYQPQLEDEYYEEDCSSSVEKTCSCIEYFLRLSSSTDEKYFLINNQTGAITLKAEYDLDKSKIYSISIELLNTSFRCDAKGSCIAIGEPLVYDRMQVTITVEEKFDFGLFENLEYKNDYPSLHIRHKREITEAVDGTNIVITSSSTQESLAWNDVVTFNIQINLPSMSGGDEGIDFQIHVDGSGPLGDTTITFEEITIENIASSFITYDNETVLTEEQVKIIETSNSFVSEAISYVTIEIPAIYNMDKIESSMLISMRARVIENEQYTSDVIATSVTAMYAEEQMLMVWQLEIPYQNETQIPPPSILVEMLEAPEILQLDDTLIVSISITFPPARPKDALNLSMVVQGNGPSFDATISFEEVQVLNLDDTILISPETQLTIDDILIQMSPSQNAEHALSSVDIYMPMAYNAGTLNASIVITLKASMIMNEYYKDEVVPISVVRLLNPEEQEEIWKTEIPYELPSNLTITPVKSLKILTQLLSNPPLTLRAGNTIESELQITARYGTEYFPMDINIMIFAKTPTKNVTSLVLFGVEIIHVGSKLLNGVGGESIKADSVPVVYRTQTMMSDIMMQERAYINFTNVYNDGDKEDAMEKMTIIIRYKMTVVYNPYDIPDKFKWLVMVDYAGGKCSGVVVHKCVSDLTLWDTVPSDLEFYGPSSVPQFSGATVVAQGPIMLPSGRVEFEFYNEGPEHDMYSIENVQVMRHGSHTNLFPMPSAKKVSLLRSVTGKTIVRALYSFYIFNSYIKEYNILGGSEYSYRFVASVFAYNAPVGSTITIIFHFKNAKWSRKLNLIVSPQSPQGLGVPKSMALISPEAPKVKKLEAIRWVLRFNLTEQSNLIACKVEHGSEFLSGVEFGQLGPYVATLPILMKTVNYYEDSWEFHLNTTVLPFQLTFEDYEHFAEMILTISYIDLNFTATQVDCDNSLQVFLPAIADDTIITSATASLGSAYTTGDGNAYPGAATGFRFTANAHMVHSEKAEFWYDIFSGNDYTSICDVRIENINIGISSMLRYQALANNLTTISERRATFNLVYLIPSNLIHSTNSDYSFEVTVTSKMLETDLGYEASARLTTVEYRDLKQIATGKAISEALPGNPNITFLANTEVFPNFPEMLKVRIKAQPNSVTGYRLVARATNGAICHIVFLAIGDNFPCFNAPSNGKENDPAQTLVITPPESDDAGNWTIDLGIVNNHGREVTAYAENIADENTIEIGIIGRPESASTIEWGITTQAYSLNTELVSKHTIFTANATAPDITSESEELVGGFAESVFTYENLAFGAKWDIDVPKNYKKAVKLTLTNAENADAIEICSASIISVGKNIPCTTPKQIEPLREETETETKISIDLGLICYYPIYQDNITENKISIFIVAKLKEGKTKGIVNFHINANGELASSEIKFNASSSKPSVAHMNLVNIQIECNQTYPIQPGKKEWIAFSIYVPPYTAVPAEVAVLTEQYSGHAVATIHNLRFTNDTGKNIVCLDELKEDSIIFTQSQLSSETPFVHSSQMNSVYANIGSLANSGASHSKGNSSLSDDKVTIEVEIMMADHEKVEDGEEIIIHFLLQLGEEIYIYTTGKAIKNEALDPFPAVIRELSIINSALSPFPQKSKLEFSAKIFHDLGQSSAELYDFLIRISLPKFIVFVNDTEDLVLDDFKCNENGTLNISATLDYKLAFLHFTDVITCNFTVTVDPYSEMPYGLQTLNRTTIMKFSGRSSNTWNYLLYLNRHQYANYQVIGRECFSDLEAFKMAPCQVWASSAINDDYAPHKSVMTDDINGWSPAVVAGVDWFHWIAFDFLSTTRVTKVTFSYKEGARSVKTYILQMSYNGRDFINACPDLLNSDDVELPADCRINSRYARIAIQSLTDSETAKEISVKIQLFGCFLGEVTINCSTTSPSTTYTDRLETWRHVLYNIVLNQLFVCELLPNDSSLRCYMLQGDSPMKLPVPSYIKGMKGIVSANQRVYAFTTDPSLLVSTVDGIKWSPVQTKTNVSYDVVPEVIPGFTSRSLDIDDFGNWKVTFDGITMNGNLVSPWES